LEVALEVGAGSLMDRRERAGRVVVQSIALDGIADRVGVTEHALATVTCEQVDGFAMEEHSIAPE
jgi:hypothetical protein